MSLTVELAVISILIAVALILVRASASKRASLETVSPERVAGGAWYLFALIGSLVDRGGSPLLAIAHHAGNSKRPRSPVRGFFLPAPARRPRSAICRHH